MGNVKKGHLEDKIDHIRWTKAKILKASIRRLLYLAKSFKETKFRKSK
jgi:hypothetical protein